MSISAIMRLIAINIVEMMTTIPTMTSNACTWPNKNCDEVLGMC